MELTVFTLPTCSSCPAAKIIASNVAKKLGVAYREIDMGTEDGLKEGLAHDICGTPSMALDSEVIIRGRLISEEKLEEEVKRRVEKWTERAVPKSPP